MSCLGAASLPGQEQAVPVDVGVRIPAPVLRRTSASPELGTQLGALVAPLRGWGLGGRRGQISLRGWGDASMNQAPPRRSPTRPRLSKSSATLRGSRTLTRLVGAYSTAVTLPVPSARVAPSLSWSGAGRAVGDAWLNLLLQPDSSRTAIADPIRTHITFQRSLPWRWDDELLGVMKSQF